MPERTYTGQFCFVVYKQRIALETDKIDYASCAFTTTKEEEKDEREKKIMGIVLFFISHQKSASQTLDKLIGAQFLLLYVC